MKLEVTSINFGQWMSDKRKAKKWNQARLAAKANCHESTIGRWERGDGTPTLEQAEQIVRVLGAELVVREIRDDEEGL